MKFRFSFNTIGGRVKVEYSREELLGSDLLKYADHLVELSSDGACGVTFETPQYGKLFVELV